MLIKLERDRVVSRVSSLEAQVRQMEAGRPDAEDTGRPQASKKPRGARLPEENLMNPYLTANIEPAPVDRWGLSKTFQGLLMIKPESCADKVTMTRLWAHECMRVFHDRLIDEPDQKYFKDLIIELVQGQLGQSWDYEEVFEDGHIMFGDYLKMGATGEDRIYGQFSMEES